VSLKIVQTAAAVETSDEFNEARLLLLLWASAGRSQTPKPLDGIMKLAKMDFLLRYPNMLVRALKAIAGEKSTATKAAAAIPEEDLDTIEARMIRFRYGPWDPRYRRWLSILVAKGLAHVFHEGRTVKILLTEKGNELAVQLSKTDAFGALAKRAKTVNLAVGDMAPTRITGFVYKIAPELVDMKWGGRIEL